MDSAYSLCTDTRCGTTGSCINYDTFDLRVKIFGMASAAAAVAALFDGLVWYVVKDLTIY